MGCKKKEQKGNAVDIPCGQRQLFVDDYCIGSMNGLKKTMHKPVKKGAVIRPDVMDGESSFQIRSAPLWDKEAQAFRLIVGGNKNYVWQSTDGLNWSMIGISERDAWTVVYDEDEVDPAKRYKALMPYYYPGGGTHKTGAAVSADMITWTDIDIPQIQCGDEWNLSYDRKNHTYIATVKRGGPYGRSVFLSTSRDFEQWSEPTLIFHADDEDQRIGKDIIDAYVSDEAMQPQIWHPTDPGKYNVDVYNMGVFAYEGIYIGMPAMFYSIGPETNYPNTYGFDIVQLVSSRDMKKWERVGGRQAFIPPSPKGAGAYDLTQIMPPSSAVIRGDELWFYYSGLKYRGEYDYIGNYPDGVSVPFHGTEKDRSAICLAVLRRDGFISLDAGKNKGTVVTRPFVPEGDNLKVNVDAKTGMMTVAILDEEGNSLAVSKTVEGDKTEACIEWDRNEFSMFKGQTVKLEFTLENASIYSFWINE